ncbi:DUF2789 family protein [Shewanella sp. Isolate7]|uniref:DUF2789 family protein n=1 Tax=Shewanella sp. Isolate7 TaxID=2908528 RepID=UPI001EFD3749|nr:DUF2789 family protein [Shewanella sp. Isolate7]MCG9719825.1 DUF2789 domain-containing protein [Shewanella sp. Isolate7]
MDITQPDLASLFDQLGLPSDPDAVEAFIKQHSIAAEIHIAEAPFWSQAQKHFLAEALGKVRTSRRTALALIAATVQGIQLRACRGLLKLNNAEMVLLSKPRRARLTAVFAALQFLRRTRAIRCKLCLASIHFKHTQSKRTALALIAATVQGIQLRACRGLLKLNNAEMVLLSKPRRARLTAVFAALQFLRRTRAIRCKLCLASIHFKHTQSKHGTYSHLP